MEDFVLVDGDEVIFVPTFGAAVVVVRPGKLAGSGPATYHGRKLCIVGDESKVAVPGCAYTTPQFSIPGIGTLKIASLATNHKAQKTRTADTVVMLVGAMFTAKFEVQSPAQQPPLGPGSPIPDPSPQYLGQGKFVTKNPTFRGT